VSWDYTAWLNIIFLLLAAVLIVRFARTGGLPMLKMMGGPPEPDNTASGHESHGTPGTGPGPTGPGLGRSGEDAAR
jgi:hypothetical protein